jgi:single-strand DNA-binding protein
MNHLNSLLIEGRLARDAVLKITSGGTPICEFTIAVERFFKQNDELQKEVNYFDVETWSKLAETCKSHGRKGRGVRVVGRVKQDNWTDPEGKSRSKVIIVAEHVEFRPESKDKETPDVLKQNGLAA